MFISIAAPLLMLSLQPTTTSAPGTTTPDASATQSPTSLPNPSATPSQPAALSPSSTSTSPAPIEPPATPRVTIVAPPVAQPATPSTPANDKPSTDEKKAPPSPFLPKGEAELMSDHPVAPDKAKWVPGKGFEMKTKDERFSLMIRARVQMQYALRHDAGADPLPTGATGKVQQSWSIRRARLVFSGNVFSKHVKYYMQLNFAPQDMNLGPTGAANTPLRDFYITYDKLRDFTIQVGQQKVPFNRERVISSGDLQMVDRALTSGEFNLDRDIGLQIRSKDFLGLGKLAYYAGVFIGDGRDAFQTSDMGLLYVGRVEVLPFGLFDDYQEADFERRLKPKLSMGTAYAFIDEAKRDRGILGATPTDGGSTDTHNVEADAIFKIGGFSAQFEFYWRQGKRRPGEAVDDMGTPLPISAPRNGYGWFAQAGYLIPRLPLEIAFRYAQARALGGSRSALATLDEVGPGLNWYFARHPLKLQLDYARVAAADGIRDGFDRIRLQLQASF